MTHIKSALKCQVIILLLDCLHLNGAIAVNSNETNVEKIQWENLTPLNWNPTQILDNMTDEQYYALSDDELLLVPYFGACTHTPPPPANQIIFGKLKTETELNDINQPVWITGTIQTSRSNSLLNESGVANGLEVQSAYSMVVELVEPYIDQE